MILHYVKIAVSVLRRTAAYKICSRVFLLVVEDPEKKMPSVNP